MNTVFSKFGRREIVVASGLFALFIVLMATIQFTTPNLVGNDGYFHIRFAQVVREQGIRPPFPWLPLTLLNNDNFYDHHFLYHILLIPFTYGDLRVGAKWAAVLFPAFAFLAGYVLLQGLRAPFAAVWSLGLLAMSEAFLYRMSMPRVQAISLLMLILILHVTLTRRYCLLWPLTFIYVWLYDGFLFSISIVFLYVVICWLLERQFNLKPLAYVVLGAVMGNLINPYFPNNITFIYQHVLPKLTETTAVNVGQEWYPYQTWSLVEHSLPALLVFIAGSFALGLSKHRMTTNTATLFIVTVFFGFILFKSRRFIEYYPAFALFFCAAAWQPIFEELLQSKAWGAKILPGVLILLFIPAIWFNIHNVQETLQDTKPYKQFAEASTWLQTNTPPGSRVFQTDWDVFPQLYFYNTHNTYIAGLDPTYMQLHNGQLYALWRDITQGRVELPALVIAATFDANYVISDLEHEEFLERATADPHLKEVYRDEYAVIFEIH